MTDTLVAPTEDATGSHDPAEQATPTPQAPYPSILSWLNTADHKQIGRLYIASAVLVLLAAMVVDMLVRIDLINALGFTVYDADSWFQLFAMSRDAVLFGVLAPGFLGLAIYVVPLQIGAGNIAFPRAATASFWGWLISLGILIGAYAVNGGPPGGEPDGVDLYLISLAAIAVSLMLGAICVGATILTYRAPGLYLTDVPTFTWASLVWVAVLVMSLGALLADLLLLYIDHRYGRLVFFGNYGLLGAPEAGFGIRGGLGWLHQAPQIFVFAFPALGVIGEIVPAAVKVRQPMDRAVKVLLGAAGFFAFGAFAQQFEISFGSGQVAGDLREEALYVAFVVAAVLPIAGLLALWGLAFMEGKFPTVTPAVVLAEIAGFLLIGGAVAVAVGAVIDVGPAGDFFRTGATTWVAGYGALVLLGGGVAGLFAGLYWWGPKLYGRMLKRGIGLLAAAAVALGAVAIAVGSFVTGGIWDQPYGAPTFADAAGSSALNALTVVGAALIVVAAALVLFDLLTSIVAGRGAEAGDNPWEAEGAEWTTSSPPPDGNFDELPELPELSADATMVDVEADG